MFRRSTMLMVLGVGLLLPGTSAAQDLDTAAVTRIQEEVTAAVDRYYRLFSERNPEALPGDVFHLPWMATGGGGMRVDLDRDESVMSVGGVAYVFGLTDDGWKILFYTSHPRERVVHCD